MRAVIGALVYSYGLRKVWEYSGGAVIRATSSMVSQLSRTMTGMGRTMTGMGSTVMTELGRTMTGMVSDWVSE